MVHLTSILAQAWFLISAVSAFRPTPVGRRQLKALRLSALSDIGEPLIQAISHSEVILANAKSADFKILQNTLNLAEEAVSQYQKVDKTGIIGLLADGIEKGIDFSHTVLQSAGIENTYGISICIFTLLVKLLTLPLTTQQLESTTKMQKLTPLQQKIAAKYANDEQTKNQLQAQLFQTANVNPLAGCLPALVQLPIFLSLYRSLTNLVAENKLDEPFLWIPDLEGPVYTAGPGSSMDWFKSIFSGNPSLGWDDTIAFLSIPLILFVSQTISQKVLQPPKDPNKILSDSEKTTQGILNNLPFIIAFFSLNVPAGLGVYWIINNFLTTLITVIVKSQFKDDSLPVEVEQMMAAIEADTKGTVMKAKVANSMQELRRTSLVEDRPRSEGFGFKNSMAIDAEIVSSSEKDASVESDVTETVGGEAEGDDGEEDDDATDVDGKKRKKRTKPTKKGRKK